MQHEKGLQSIAYRQKADHMIRSWTQRRLTAAIGCVLAIGLLTGYGAIADGSVDVHHADVTGKLWSNSTNTLIGQVPDYSADNANEEGYWYSRYSLGSLTRQSGLGQAFSMAQMQAVVPSLMRAVGATSDDPIVLPTNVALLYEVYAGGDPHFRTPLLDTTFLKDAGDARWVGGPARLTTASTGFTVTKELEWAKMFHRAAHFGEPNVDHFGSFWRFQGMVFAMEAKATLNDYLANRSKFERSRTGDYALLLAFSDATGMYSAPDLANNQGPNALPPSYSPANRYLDAVAAANFAAAARAEFQTVLATQPESAQDLGLAIQSTIWYASVTHDPQEHARAGAAVRRWGDRLARMAERRSTEASSDDHQAPVDRAYEVRGLIEAGRTTGDLRYLQAAADAFARMTAHFDYQHGVLNGTHTLTSGDVGEIAGAFNAAQIFLTNYINVANANTLFGDWWEGNLDLSGMEISSPAVTAFKSSYELLDPPGRGTVLQSPLNYRYPSVPLPQDAGGPNGIAMVLASWIKWDSDNQTWYANHNWFDTAGAMHAAIEFMWFHSDEVNGFPVVSL